MARRLAAIVAVVLALTVLSGVSQTLGDIQVSDYLRLLRATRYVENYKEVAAVSARVFGARALPGDKEYARFMSVIATADLSDANECFVAVYKRQNLSQQDIATLVAIFESPLGVKILEQSQRMLIADIERGSHQPLSPEAFTEDEKRRLQEIRQDPSFRKYGMMTANQRFATGMITCIGESDAVKSAGIKK